MNLRLTTIDDLAWVLSLEANSENKANILQWTKEQHAEIISSPNCIHACIEDEGMVGYFILKVDRRNRSVEVTRLVVTRKGMGYGSKALKTIEALALDHYQYKRMWFDVKEFNTRAIKLYKTLGFVVEGTLRSCLKNGDNYESLHIMAKISGEDKTSGLPPATRDLGLQAKFDEVFAPAGQPEANTCGTSSPPVAGTPAKALYLTPLSMP